MLTRIALGLIPAILALGLPTGLIDPGHGALAAECAATIEKIEKNYAKSREDHSYSDELAKKMDTLLRKARTRLQRGNKRGCFKAVKKARNILLRKQGIEPAANKEDAKKRCAAELKATEKKFSISLDEGYKRYPPAAERSINLNLSKANSFMKEGKYGKCRAQINKARKKIEVLESRG